MRFIRAYVATASTVLFFGIFYGVSASATAACDIFLSSPTLIEAFHSAISDDYEIGLFTKQVQGKTKLLVLLGEVHVKSKASAEIGKKLVNQFQYVGFEGFDPTKTIGGKLSANVIDPLIRKIGIQKLPQFWSNRMLGRLAGKRGRTEGSTIYEAKVSELRAVMQAKIESRSAEELARFITALEKIPESSRDEGFEVEGVKVFSMRDLLEIANLALAKGPMKQVAERTGPIETFHLEDGHTPTFVENWYSIDDHIGLGIIAAYYALASFIPEANKIEAIILADSYFFYGIAGTLLRSRFKASNWYQKIFPLGMAALTGRNATMVRNIIQIIDEKPEVSELLAIVGKSHIEGMKRLLISAGFSPIPIPTVHQSKSEHAFEASNP